MPRLSVTSGRPITNGSQDPHLGLAHLTRYHKYSEEITDA